jgi:PAS domain S-box-containing protein
LTPKKYDAAGAAPRRGDDGIAMKDDELLAGEQAARVQDDASEPGSRDLVQSLDAIVWEADGETCPRRFTFVSQRAESMLGFPAVRWITEPGVWASAIHPDDRERAIAACREGLEGKHDFQVEYRMVAASGGVVWLHDVVRVVRDATGCVSRRRGVMVDITDRKRAEETAAALLRIGRGLSESLDVHEVAQRIADSVRPLLNVGYAVVYRADPESGDLVSMAFCGEADEDSRKGRVIPRETGVPGAAVHERRPVVTADLLNDPRILLTPDMRVRVERTRYRAALGVPLIVKGTVVGALGVGDEAGRAFDAEAIRLAQAFADLAALALENARLFEESEHRRRSTEALLEIARTLASGLEWKMMLKVIGQQAARALGASRCTINLFHAETLVPVMSQFADGHRDAVLWAEFEARSAAGRDTIPVHAEAARTKRPVVIEDAVASDRVPADWVEVFGVRSILVVPLIHKDEVVGVLNLDQTAGPYRWRRDQIDLAVTIANQAALSIERADLYRRAEERARSLTALARLTGLITSARGRREVFRAVAESAATLLGAKLARVWIDDPPRRLLRIEASFGLDPRVEETMSDVVTIAYGQGMGGSVFVTRVAEYISDVQKDPRWLDQRLAREAGLHACAGLPLIVGERIVGLLVILCGKRRVFTEEDKELMSLLADHAAVAIRNTERFASEARMAQLRQQVLSQVLSAQEEERARVARELHDETGQSLASLVVGLSALENARTLRAAKTQAGTLRRLASSAVVEVRRLAWGLRPSALDDLGLVAALERYAAEYGRARGIRVEVRAPGLDERLPSQVEVALYRIVQEALTNVARHAGAKAVAIVIAQRRSSAQLTVRDDGRGFDVETSLSRGGALEHAGLHGIRERAALLGGSVTIESEAGKGTAITVELPVPERLDVKD